MVSSNGGPIFLLSTIHIHVCHMQNFCCQVMNIFVLDLFEERALLLSRLGRHELALAIYAHVLKDPGMAEE